MNRSNVKANASAIIFVAFDIQSVPSEWSRARNPLNIALAIDCSGSMQQEDKFEYAQQAAVSLVKSLHPTDTISIISFETQARVEIPSTTAHDPPSLENAIAALPMGRETDLYEGLRLAWEQISNADRPGIVSRILLLTDGEPTRGKTKLKDFMELAEQIHQAGVTVTTVGVGAKYNEKLLMAISEATGSLWYHVSNPSYVTSIFADELAQLGRTIVQSPSLKITAHESTEILDAYKMRPMVTRVTVPKTHPTYTFRLKDIVEGEDQTFFLRTKVPSRPSGQYGLLQVELGDQRSELTVNYTDDEQLAKSESNPYPRLLWVAGDGLTQLQSWLDGETKARTEAETRIRTLLSDNNLPKASLLNPNLEKAVTQLRQVHDEATRVGPSSMSEDDKKRLKQQTRVLKMTG